MKPKVGLLMLAAGWFWEKGIQGSSRGRYTELASVVEKDREKVVKRLKERLNVVDSGLVISMDKAVRAVEKFKDNRIELLIVCHLMWSEDQPLLKVLNEMAGIPMIFWCHSPHKNPPARLNAFEIFRGSGPVGTLQSSIGIKRLGRDFEFVIGSPDDDAVIKSIEEFARVVRLSNELKDVKIGVLPYRCGSMSDTYIDEFRLMRQLGPALKFISIGEFSSLANEIKESEVKTYVAELKKSHEVSGVSDRSLAHAARASLGLVNTVKKFSLDALALDDINDELHRVMGLRPCLYPPALNKLGTIIGMEGDVTGTTAMLILNRLSGEPAMFVEIFTFDKTENSIYAGHAGPQNIKLAKDDGCVKIIPDYEYDTSAELEGAWMYFMAKPGRVTMLNLVSDEDSYKMVIAGGEASDGAERAEGFPNIHIKLDAPVERFFTEAVKTGVTHHWAVVHADIINSVEKLADMLKLKKVVINKSNCRAGL